MGMTVEISTNRGRIKVYETDSQTRIVIYHNPSVDVEVDNDDPDRAVITMRERP